MNCLLLFIKTKQYVQNHIAFISFFLFFLTWLAVSSKCVIIFNYSNYLSLALSSLSLQQLQLQVFYFTLFEETFMCLHYNFTFLSQILISRSCKGSLIFLCMVPRTDLRALHLLGKCSTPFFLGAQAGLEVALCPPQALSCDPPASVSPLVRITAWVTVFSGSIFKNSLQCWSLSPGSQVCRRNTVTELCASPSLQPLRQDLTTL